MAELNEAALAVAEVAEHVADHAETVAKVSRALTQRELSIMITSVAGGILCGFSTGYFIAKRRLEKMHSLRADEAIAEMREHYMAEKEEENPELEALLEEVIPDSVRQERAERIARTGREKRDLNKLVEDLGYEQSTELRVLAEGSLPVEPVKHKITATPIPVPPTADEIIHKTREEAAIRKTNIWDSQTPEDVWDYPTEIKGRDPNSPYIIHKDEFELNENEWIQGNLTYYEDDDVLADEQDGVLDQDDTVGVENLGKFGHGSKDPNIVYIRNELLHMELEVVHSDGNYGEEVHGLSHSDEPPRRRGRRHHATE